MKLILLVSDLNSISHQVYLLHSSSYAELMALFKESVRHRMSGMNILSRLTTALRIVYYDLVVEYLEEKRQVIPCYAGLLNVHINSDGGIWPCAILAYRSEMGKVSLDHDFQEVWRSDTAKTIRKTIRNRECACPLANQAYSNILLHPPSLFKALWIAIRGK